MRDAADPAFYEGPRRRLAALIEASLALSSSPDLPTLLRRILDLATEHIGAERGALFRLTPDGEELVASIFHGTEMAQIVVPAGQGVAGSVADTGQSVHLADAYSDARFDRTVDERTGFRTRSLLAVPLRLRSGEILGVLEVLNKREGEFDDDDQAFLEAFGAQAAVALENARLIEERIRSERLAAVGTWATTLVHDLRNPLSGIRGYADVVVQDPPPELRERCVSGIRRQALRMDHLVRSILRYVQGREEFLHVKVDVDELLDEIAADLEAAFHGEGVTIERGEGRVGTARMDPMAIRRLVDNLARNAVEAMDATGRIRLTASLAKDRVLIRVEDDGQGMDVETIQGMFEAFETRGKKEGTGLGLHIVRRILDGHEGEIRVDSKPGSGTRIEVDLPVGGPSDASDG